MLNSLPPFNIELLLLLGKEKVQNLRQVKVMDIMVGMTKNFHPEGLYSTEIFGKVGDARRSRTFGYIDLYISIFHPVYFKALTELKELYGGIMSGREYAIYDHTTNDFVKSDPVNGETGFKFFLDHFKTLKFTERESAKRSFNIKLIEKYRASPMLDKLPVLPAGLRDYTIDKSGKPTEDEINNLYRRILGISSVAENISFSNNEEYLNSTRYNLQLAVNNVYNYIVEILEGKGKLIQGKWVARNIDNSTRNVITPYIQQIKSKDDEQFVSATQHVVGLYQFLRAIFPKSMQLVRDDFLPQVFPGPNTPANLVDPKTLKSVSTLVDPSFYDDWMTSDGLEKKFHMFKIKDLRHEPIKIQDMYLGLMYAGPKPITSETDKSTLPANSKKEYYRFMQSIDELPEGWDKQYVHPITYAELFYLAVYKIAPKIPGFITRYPITGMGSIYPSMNYLKTTIKGVVRYKLDDDWNATDDVAPEFPVIGDYFFDALSPASQHLGRLGGDYDGKQCCRL